MKISKWLDEYVDSHSICNSKEAGDDFKKQTGKDAPEWTVTTVGELRKDLGKFKGPERLEGKDSDVVTSGWWMSAAIEEKFLGTNSDSAFFGRGSMFRANLEALKAAGL